MIYQGKDVQVYVLRNSKGMIVKITNFGARIVSLVVSDREGRPTDVVLGFDQVEDYFPERHSSDFGAAIGRYANRIGGGRIVVDGQEVQLPQNNGPHCLHGGPLGWQYQVFDVVSATDSVLELGLISPDGDNGFPGEVKASVTYTMQDDNTLRVDYHATTNKTTVINMTNHSYFNLNGDAATTILNHKLTISADRYTPIDATYIPVGEIVTVKDTPMDFRQGKTIGEEIGSDFAQLLNGNGYDHNWVLNTRGQMDSPCAQLESPSTGIVMQVYTTEPGMQIYTGNFLDGTVIGKSGVAYQQRSAICLETQKFPDSPNNQWPESNAYLRPGEEYRSTTKFTFLTK